MPSVARDQSLSLARSLFAAATGTVDERWPFDTFLHAWWVRPGRMLAGEYPGHTDALRARQKIDMLVDAGIRTFFDLTTPADGLAPFVHIVRAVAAARQLDVRHFPFPIPDLGVVGDDDYDVAANAIDESLDRGGVYIHCWGGIGRTGTVIGCVLADEGLDYEAIIERLAELRRGSRKEPRAAPEMAAQHDVIRRRVSARADNSGRR